MNQWNVRDWMVSGLNRMVGKRSARINSSEYVPCDFSISGMMLRKTQRVSLKKDLRPQFFTVIIC